MDTPKIERAAALLVGARRNGTLLEALPSYASPASIAEAHAIQDAVTAGLGRPVSAYRRWHRPMASRHAA
jgi:2-keto-4-pentenoate hydratase